MASFSRSRTAQLIFQSFYCALALVACVGSVGFFDMHFTSDFYIYFTNISVYFSAVLMFAQLVQTAERKEDGCVSTLPRLHFVGMLGLILTFMVFNFMLANDPARDPALNYKPECVLSHIVLPVLFTADWVLFFEHGRVGWKLPLLCALYPLIYVAYVYLHAALWHFDSSIMNYAGTDPIIYPYFFLNPERVGISGILTWVFALLSAFVAGGYLFMLMDCLLARKKK